MSVRHDVRQIRLIVQTGPLVKQNVSSTCVDFRYSHVTVRALVTVQRRFRLVKSRRGVAGILEIVVEPARPRRAVYEARSRVFLCGDFRRNFGGNTHGIRRLFGVDFEVFPPAQGGASGAVVDFIGCQRGLAVVVTVGFAIVVIAFRGRLLFGEIFGYYFATRAVVVAVPVAVRVACVGYVMAAV